MESEAKQKVIGFNDLNFYPISIILLISSLYFLTSECRQLIGSGFGYFLSVWNYLDIIPAVVIPIIVVSDYMRLRYDLIHSMNAFTAMTMWLKFLYFL